MLRTIVLHGELASRFGSSFELDVKSPVEAIRALIVQIRGFRQALRDGHYHVLKVRPQATEDLELDELKLRLGKAREIHIVPVLQGSASSWGKILAGVAIIGLAIAAPYALGMLAPVTGSLGLSAALGASTGIFGITFGNIAAVGAAMALGGVAQMLAPAPSLAGGSAAVDRKESFLFGSAENVTAQGVPVPVGFGEFIAGSVVISSGLSTEELGVYTPSAIEVLAAANGLFKQMFGG